MVAVVVVVVVYSDLVDVAVVDNSKYAGDRLYLHLVAFAAAFEDAYL